MAIFHLRDKLGYKKNQNWLKFKRIYFHASSLWNILSVDEKKYKQIFFLVNEKKVNGVAKFNFGIE